MSTNLPQHLVHNVNITKRKGTRIELSKFVSCKRFISANAIQTTIVITGIEDLF